MLMLPKKYFILFKNSAGTLHLTKEKPLASKNFRHCEIQLCTLLLYDSQF